MKQVTYYNQPENKIYFLTDKEFKVAKKAWDNNSSFYCKRLEALLSANFKFAETPREDMGYEVFIDWTLTKIFKKDGKYYYEVEDVEADDGKTKKVLDPRKLKEGTQTKELNNIVPQEQYYEGRQSIRGLSNGTKRRSRSPH